MAKVEYVSGKSPIRHFAGLPYKYFDSSTSLSVAKAVAGGLRIEGYSARVVRADGKYRVYKRNRR